jgi:hypothetical protein
VEATDALVGREMPVRLAQSAGILAVLQEARAPRSSSTALCPSSSGIEGISGRLVTRQPTRLRAIDDSVLRVVGGRIEALDLATGQRDCGRAASVCR